MREPTKGTRITGESRTQLATDLKEQYEQGTSIRALAQNTGRSYGFVHQMLNEARANLRRRGRTHHRAQAS